MAVAVREMVAEAVVREMAVVVREMVEEAVVMEMAVVVREMVVEVVVVREMVPEPVAAREMAVVVKVLAVRETEVNEAGLMVTANVAAATVAKMGLASICQGCFPHIH